MKEYLANRDSLYVSSQSLLSSMSEYNDSIQIAASIKRTINILSEIEQKANILNENIEEAEYIFENIINGLEEKISSVSNKIDAYMANIGILGSNGTISVISLESCSYNNMAYSSNDMGVILES